MAPKKGKKMDLGAFLADEATGSSWADEMDSFPTAPSGEAAVPGGLGGSHLRGGDYAGRSGGYGDRGGAGDYGDRPQRVEVPFPTAPPYTAFVGNLTFEYGEADMQQFFSGVNTTSIRMVNGPDGKPKGFCYVEFGTADDLRTALNMTGQDAGGRTVRISVAEPPKGREGRADEDMTWERQGPLAPLAGRGGSSFGGGRDGGAGGFDRPRDNGFGGSGEGERDGPRAGFGSKFVPSVDAPRRTGGYERAGPGGSSYDRSGVGAPEEDRGERGGFGSKFVPAPPAAVRPAFGDRRSSGAPGEGRADEEKTWSRQGPLAPIAGARGPRTGGFGDAPRASFGDAPPSDSSAGPQRRRLELSARSTTSTDSSPASSPAPSRPSPFGAARPVDFTEKDRAAEAKLAAEQAATAARVAAEKERKASEPTREDKLAAARAAVVAPKVEVEKVAEPTVASPPASAAVLTSLRKDGFSYSTIANAKDEELMKQLGETTI